MNNFRICAVVVTLGVLVFCSSCGSGSQPSSSSAASGGSLSFSSGPSVEDIMQMVKDNGHYSINDFQITNTYERDIIVDGLSEHAYFIEADYTHFRQYAGLMSPSGQSQDGCYMTSPNVEALVSMRDIETTGNAPPYIIHETKRFYEGVLETHGKFSCIFYKRGNRWNIAQNNIGMRDLNGVVTPYNQEEKNLSDEIWDAPNDSHRSLGKLIDQRNRYPARFIR